MQIESFAKFTQLYKVAQAGSHTLYTLVATLYKLVAVFMSQTKISEKKKNTYSSKEKRDLRNFQRKDYGLLFAPTRSNFGQLHQLAA